MVYVRFAAAVVLVASLAGCAVGGSSDLSAKYQKSDGPDVARPAQSVRRPALPGDFSNQDTVPARPAGSVLGLLRAVPPKPTGFVGIPSRRPEPAVAPVRPAVAPVPVSQPRRVLTFADLVSSRQLRELGPMGTPLRAESYTLADLIEDQAWRKRTSQHLDRLFQ